MKPIKILFVLTILGIFSLMILTQTTKQIQTGKIKEIKYSNEIITIQIENLEEELVLFHKHQVDLKENDVISFQGKSDTYKNKKQIIVDKIWKNV